MIQTRALGQPSLLPISLRSLGETSPTAVGQVSPGLADLTGYLGCSYL